MDAETSDKLRAKFPKDTVGVLPKPFKKESPKGNCRECGGYHGLPAVHLDFVGHAAVTDRLLSVDPEWTWEPFAVGPDGLPALDRQGNLWIRLTVAGVTRIGIGDGTSLKETIGDAIRNAAMRFGVALSLWTKDELESGHAEDKPHHDDHHVDPPRPPVDPTVAIKRRIQQAVNKQGLLPDGMSLGDWVAQEMAGLGLDPDVPDDLIKLAEDLEGK